MSFGLSIPRLLCGFCALFCMFVAPQVFSPAGSIAAPNTSAIQASTRNLPGQSPQRKTKEPVRWRPRIDSRAEFDSLSRTYYQGRFYALPHIMFVIDRAAKEGAGNRIYYVNSKRYSFHGEFANANYLTLERGREFFRHNYLEANRRFILGTIAWQTKAGKFTFEFWEGDLATADIVRETSRALSKNFFAPLYFKPNSARQEGFRSESPATSPDCRPQISTRRAITWR
jgi:hypothetical protein